LRFIRFDIVEPEIEIRCGENLKSYCVVELNNFNLIREYARNGQDEEIKREGALYKIKR